MKSENLKRLADAGFPVPAFRTFKSADEADSGFSPKDVFAVRSSFSGEDGNEYSYAGQFLTLLNVKRGDVPAAVRKVIDDAEYSCRAYAEARGADKGGSMLVVVQEMIAADLSGVMFTANPCGLVSESVLTVGEGTGDGVVDGRVPTATYFCDRIGGGYYFDAQPGAPELREPLLRELTALGEKTEKLFGRPMDVEFAVADGKVYILQARPITTLPDGDEAVLDNSNIVESFPGVCSPATQDFAKAVYEAVFTSCLRRLTHSKKMTAALRPTLSNMVEAVNGRMYYRIDNWYALLSMLPFSGKLIPVWQDMLGVSRRKVSMGDMPAFGLLRKTVAVGSFVCQFLTAPRHMRELDKYFSDNLPRFRYELAGAGTPGQLLELYDELLSELGDKWSMTLVNDLYAFVFTALACRRHSGEISDIGRLSSLEPVRAMNRLALIAASHGLDSPAYQRGKKSYINKYGDRALRELKLETVTMRTDPSILDDAVRQRMSAGSAGEAISGAAKKADAWTVRRAKLGIEGRESARLNRSRIYGIAREIFLRLGDNFADRGIIDERDDIFMLRFDEIRSCAAAYRDMRKTVEARRSQCDMFAQLPATPRMVFRGPVTDRSPQRIGRRTVAALPDVMRGTACSAGRATGEVLVVDRPSLDMDTRGKILVAAMTDPGWVFLIQNAAGVVAEKGSLLSHTAIITRELRKPAVVGVEGAVGLLKTGDIVALDGDSGTVRLLSRPEEAAI